MTDEFRRLVVRHIGREPAEHDGISEEQLVSQELRLDIRLPGAIREYYGMVGRNEQLNRSHNELVWLEDLAVDGGFVVFMVENQAVVCWGVRTEDLSEPDPEVWQLMACDPSKAHSERLPFSRFIVANVVWQFGQGLGLQQNERSYRRPRGRAMGIRPGRSRRLGDPGQSAASTRRTDIERSCDGPSTGLLADSIPSAT